jgi:fibronectin-binding autotransporter adhesin
LNGSAAHTYTGATTISAGTFAVNPATSNLTGTSGVSVASGATLRLFANNGGFTFSRNISGVGTVVLDPNAGGTAGSREVTLTGTNTGFNGTWLLQPSGTVAANGSFRTVAAQANLGTAAIVVKPGGQLWWTGTINNNVTISGTGYSEAAGGTPAAGTGLAYGGLGALRMGSVLAGTLTLDGTARIANYTGNATISGNIGVTNPSDLLVVGGGTDATADSLLILTGTNNAAGAGSLNQVWVNAGGAGNRADILQIGNNGTAGTLGTGNVILHADAARSSQLRFSRSDGYTLAQDILASVNTASADLGRTYVAVNTTGTGLTLNGRTLDLSNGTNGGNLTVAGVLGGTGVNNAILNIDAGSVVDVGYIGIGEAANFSGTVNQTGGAVSVITTLRVGHYNTETSTYNLSAGTVTFSGTPASTPSAGGEVNGGLYIGIDGTGVFNHSGGTVSTRYVVLDNRGDTPAGANMPTGVDQYNLSGTGVLELNSIWGLIARNASTAVTWNGGTIRNTGASIAVGINAPIAVGAGGGTLDTVSAGNSFVLMNDLTGAGTLTSTGGGTLTLNPDSNAQRTGTSTGSGTQTISAALAGTSPVSKIGSGTSTLSGVNTYNGATTVTAGRLNITGSAANSAFTVASGATLGGEGAVGNLTLSAGASLSINPNTTGALTAGAFGSAATNTVVLEALPTSLGAITVLNYSGTRTGATSDFAVSSAANYRAPVFNDTGTKITLDTGAKALVWDGTGGGQWDLNTSSRWNPGQVDRFFWGDHVTFDDNGVTSAVTLTGDIRPGAMIVNSSAAGRNYTLTASAGNVIAGPAGLLKAGTSVLTMAGNTANTFTGGTTIREGTIRVQNGGSLGTGTITLGDAGTGAGNTALYIDTNRTTVSAPVVASNNGSGTATLGSRNTITGTGAFGFSNITLQRDVVLDSNAADRTDYTNISGAGNITITGAARSLFNSANTFVGNIVVSPSGTGGYFQTGLATAGNQNYIPDTSSLTVNDFVGAAQAEYRLSSGGETIAGLSGNGTIDVNSINGTLTVGSGDASSTFSGQMINGGASILSLTKIGAGTLTLTGNNTATGAITVNGGTLRIGTGGTTGAIAGALAVAAGATAIVDRSDASALAGGLTGAGTFTKAGAGTFNLNAGGSLSGTFNLNGGTVVFNATNPTGANATAATFNLAAGTVLTTTTASTHAHFGVLNMEGGATITTGTGTGSYNGENFQLNGNVTVAGGTTAAVITRDAGRNDGNSGLALRGVRTFSVADVTGSATPDLIISTQLEPSDNDAGANQGALTKTGPGTLQLTGANTYTGATLVQAGTLLIDNTHTGGGLITVSAGASLGGSTGTGQIGGVDMSAGGSLLPGDTARTDNWMNVQDLNLGATTQFFFELGLPDNGTGPLPANDLVTVVGSLSALGGVLNVADLGGVASAPLGSRWQIFDMPNGAPPTHSLTLGVVPARTDGLIYEIEALDSTVAAYLVVVPEAGTAGLVALGLLLLRRLRRR